MLDEDNKRSMTLMNDPLLEAEEASSRHPLHECLQKMSVYSILSLDRNDNKETRRQADRYCSTVSNECSSDLAFSYNRNR